MNLQDVAQSVTALSTEDIAKQAFQSLDDVAGALPSVTLVNAIPGRNDIIMRGISTGTGEYYTDSQVSVYLDDQPMTSSSQQVDVRLIDIERIEVLPGPQGTLFGSSSQSGTIRYVTNKPNPSGYSSQVDAEIGTTKGGEESYDISGHVNIPLGDNFAIRAVGFYAQRRRLRRQRAGPESCRERPTTPTSSRRTGTTTRRREAGWRLSGRSTRSGTPR